MLAQLAEGTHSGPHSVLGQHPVDGTDAVVIRVLRPLAREVVAVLDSGARIELGHIGWGVWQGVSVVGFQDYVIETVYDDDTTWTADDPYRYLPSVGEVDLHLFGEGRHERLWEMLGAHHRELHGVDRGAWGTSFSVWAPHAQAVRMIGDFNSWDGRLYAMRRLDLNGVWELFIPGLEPVQRLQVRDPHAERASGSRRPTRWPGTPSRHRPPPASSPRARTAGATPAG